MRYRAIAIFDGYKPLKMGVFRKPRFSKYDVEKAMEGFFNNLLVQSKLTEMIIPFDRVTLVHSNYLVIILR